MKQIQKFIDELRHSLRLMIGDQESSADKEHKRLNAEISEKTDGIKHGKSVKVKNEVHAFQIKHKEIIRVLTIKVSMNAIA